MAEDVGKDRKSVVLERLLAANEAWYDIYRDYEFAGRTFAGYAEFHSHGERYVLVKRAKLWEVDAHDYMFFDLVDHLDAETLLDVVSFVQTRGLEKVDPKPNHMRSSLSLVVIADSVDDAAKRACRKARFRKSFALGIRGWADLRLAVVDVSERTVVTNAMGKEMRASIEANVAPARADAGKEE